MSTLFWVLLGVAYGVIYMISVRMLAGHLAWRMLNNHNEYYRTLATTHPSLEQWFGAPSLEQWFGAICIAVFVGILRPVVGVSIRWPVVAGAERDAKLKMREEKLAQMERDLNLR